MDLKNQKIREQNRDMVLKLIPIVYVIAKFIHLEILPDKYYFDSWRIISMLNDMEVMSMWGGYQDTVDFYSAINVFHLVYLSEWSIVVGMVMTPVMMWMISRTKQMEIRECIFALMAAGLLNIYVFSITKELIQLLFFALIYIIISLPIKNTLVKVVGCAAVYYWESTFYRAYYIIMAAMSIFLYFVFLWLRKREKITKKHVIITVILCFMATFLFLYLSSFISYSDYNEAINVRDNSANEGANTVILNPIEVNSNFGIFMFDYVIAGVRMMFPIELLIKSPVYAPFVVFQIFILYYFFKTLANVRKIDANMLVVISCFSAYLFGSFIFEPDFGSWVRHETATFPLLQMMAFKSQIYGEMGEVSQERIDVYETKNV